ncbi:MAG: response regulator [Lachnospiraceae bacterium]
MKKVLLIGCLNKTLGGIKDCLGGEYEVQLCPEKADAVKDMVCMIEPDLIIVSQVGMVDEDIPIFDLFQTRYLRVPMLIIALKELESHFDLLLLTDRKIMTVYRPVTKSKILECCDKLLKSEKPADEEDTKGKTKKSDKEDDLEASYEEEWRHILVVDDSQLVLRNVKRLLRDRYHVTMVESGRQAISYMEKKKPDLVLLDYEMPGWDGKKTLEVMRENPDLSDIPVVFLTGIYEREHIMSVLQLNPAGYLLKPTEQDKLIETIEEALHKDGGNKN